MEHPPPGRRRPGTAAVRADLETVPDRAGARNAGLRLLHRRHRVAETDLRAVLRPDRPPPGPRRRRHSASDRRLGRPTGPEPADGPRPTHGRTAVPAPRPG